MTPLYGTAIWHKLNHAERAELRRHAQAWQMSQFLHGEQGALLCAARVVQQSDSYDTKCYAATQVMDEARHVEIFTRLLTEKFGFFYPISPSMKSLLESVITHKEWDIVYLGMQVVIEGLALAAFQMIRDHATNPLAIQVNTFVMQDEARHVAFGRLALRDYYAELQHHERREREEFLIEACRLMRDRLFPDEIWERLNLDRRKCKMEIESSIHAQFFRHQLFSRIVPAVRDIGLWGPDIRAAYAAMGINDYARTTTSSQLERDEQLAIELQRATLIAAPEDR
jgi:hypothetical protein